MAGRGGGAIVVGRELLGIGCWSRSPNGDIAISFPQAMVMVRRRAFSIATDRERFLARARVGGTSTAAGPPKRIVCQAVRHIAGLM